MKVAVSPDEVWPELTIEPGVSDEDGVDLPDALFTDWRNARIAMHQAENRILRHLRDTGQPIPDAFDDRVAAL